MGAEVPRKVCFFFLRGPEVPIMDYVTQQHKILPQVAGAYAYHFTIKEVLRVYHEFLENLEKGVLKNFAEVRFVCFLQN